MKKKRVCRRRAVVIGLLLSASHAWAVAPLFQRQPISLETVNSVVRESFQVRKAWTYSLNIDFEFPSGAAIFQDTIVGSRYDASCSWRYEGISVARRAGLGRPIPVHVTIRRRDDHGVVLDQDINSLCLTGTSATGFIKSRTISKITLTPGDYAAEITNLQPQSGLDGVKTYLSLTAGHSK